MVVDNEFTEIEGLSVPGCTTGPHEQGYSHGHSHGSSLFFHSSGLTSRDSAARPAPPQARTSLFFGVRSNRLSGRSPGCKGYHHSKPKVKPTVAPGSCPRIEDLSLKFSPGRLVHLRSARG